MYMFDVVEGKPARMLMVGMVTITTRFSFRAQHDGCYRLLDRSSSAISVRHDEARWMGLALGTQDMTGTVLP